MITIKDIEKALRNREIYLVYQPIFCLKTDSIVAYEALARWKFKGNFISPAIFMGLGDLPLMRSLTQYILELAEKTETEFNIPIHVNISIYDLASNITSKVSCLEITEETSRSRQIDYINKLSKNYQIVIDDFGKDYSSWVNLPYINISKIKLDRQIVNELSLTHSIWYQDVISFVVKMANRNNITIVAEGIEKESQLILLKSLSVHQGQGYLLGVPQTGVCRTHIP